MKVNNTVSIILIIVLIVIIGYLVFSKKNINQNIDNKSVTTQNKNSSTNNISNEESDGWSKIMVGANPIVEENITLSDTIIDLGQEITLNSLSWSPLTRLTTAGKFIEVDLRLTNSGQQGEGVQAIVSDLYDQNNRYYTYQFGHSDCEPYGFTEGIQILKPDIPCTMKMVFEVGQSSKSFTLNLNYKKEN